MPPLETRTDSPGDSPEVPQDPCQHSTGILRFRTNSTQGLRPPLRRERNPERPPCNSHGDWPILRPPERVTEVLVVSQEHLPQLEKIRRFSPPGERRPISAEAFRGYSHLTSGTSKGSFTRLLQLKKFPDIPSPLERKHESPAHIQRSPVSAS